MIDLHAWLFRPIRLLDGRIARIVAVTETAVAISLPCGTKRHWIPANRVIEPFRGFALAELHDFYGMARELIEKEDV